ncbi:class I SAM-dependent methyltransferase [Chitinophaga qingshengii]|uniref:[phosphatase 2A protein]-leucine-carboxy methyltransferase n=1 Tax=Chitinophaga qingshengii TaxID=1569794 RepID=A0ABR7TS50_9BACT|nr:class I SAM-dependent methyltransferase [Chitinophaga qingshengii]MBC9932291.1 class I SAM-dependent methyltransferase [Chitinophaga qingshengii]
MTRKLKVPATSRLVLEQAIKLYDSPLQQAYINAIDFSETSRLSRDFKRAYPPVGETVYYRKQAVRDMIQQRITQYPTQQVLILGAGLDPLSLYLLEQYPGRISRIVEVDNGYIGEKKKIYEEILHINGPLHLLRCDLTDPLLLETMLIQAGYTPEEPAIIIMEGVLPYISNEECVQLMQLLATPQRHHLGIFDYLMALPDIPDNFLVYHRNVLNLMETQLNSHINANTRDQIKDMITRFGRLEYLEPLCVTEKKLTGINRTFHQPGHGIVEMAVFSL